MSITLTILSILCFGDSSIREDKLLSFKNYYECEINDLSNSLEASADRKKIEIFKAEQHYIHDVFASSDDIFNLMYKSEFLLQWNEEFEMNIIDYVDSLKSIYKYYLIGEIEISNEFHTYVFLENGGFDKNDIFGGVRNRSIYAMNVANNQLLSIVRLGRYSHNMYETTESVSYLKNQNQFKLIESILSSDNQGDVNDQLKYFTMFEINNKGRIKFIK